MSAADETARDKSTQRRVRTDALADHADSSTASGERRFARPRLAYLRSQVPLIRLPRSIRLSLLFRSSPSTRHRTQDKLPRLGARWLLLVVPSTILVLLARRTAVLMLPPTFALAPTRATMSTTAPPPNNNIVIIGASYVGSALVSSLVSIVPEGHRIVHIEKNSHFGHLFAFPRFALTDAQGSTHKAFIPFVSPPGAEEKLVRVRGNAVEITKERVVLDRDSPAFAGKEIPYKALVLATGTRLTPPGTLPGEEKWEGVEWFAMHQEEVRKAEKIVIVGGGAVGVRTSLFGSFL